MEDNKLIFPLAIFPKSIQDIIHDLDMENGYPIPYTAAAFFHAFACAIGNSCTCRFMENWETAPILYTALVGGPGSIKTHPVSFAMAPLVRRDKVSLEEYSQQLEQYRSTQIDTRGPKPKARQRIVRDITLEALAKVLKANPVGVCVYVDELKGWLSSFNKYRNGGGDKEAWLSMYSGEPIVVNRKTQDEVDTIPHPFASVIGTIQPGVLPKVFQSDIDNGFFPRLLYVLNPNDGEPVLWKEEEDLPSGTAERWDKALAPVLSFADAFNMGIEEPVTYTFSTPARLSLVDWQNKNEIACAEDIRSCVLDMQEQGKEVIKNFDTQNKKGVEMGIESDPGILKRRDWLESVTTKDLAQEPASAILKLMQPLANAITIVAMAAAALASTLANTLAKSLEEKRKMLSALTRQIKAQSIWKSTKGAILSLMDKPANKQVESLQDEVAAKQSENEAIQKVSAQQAQEIASMKQELTELRGVKEENRALWYKNSTLSGQIIQLQGDLAKHEKTRKSWLADFKGIAEDLIDHASPEQIQRYEDRGLHTLVGEDLWSAAKATKEERAAERERLSQSRGRHRSARRKGMGAFSWNRHPVLQCRCQPKDQNGGHFHGNGSEDNGNQLFRSCSHRWCHPASDDCRRGGSIAVTTSIAGRFGFPLRCAYSSSKFAL